jgi:hypothetical protein
LNCYKGVKYYGWITRISWWVRTVLRAHTSNILNWWNINTFHKFLKIFYENCQICCK